MGFFSLSFQIKRAYLAFFFGWREETAADKYVRSRLVMRVFFSFSHVRALFIFSLLLPATSITYDKNLRINDSKCLMRVETNKFIRQTLTDQNLSSPM